MLVVHRVRMEEVLGLRERALTPGHPGRPVVWPYDAAAEHFGMFEGDRLVGCVSVTAEPMPGRAARCPYHLHSMAVEEDRRGGGLGRFMLDWLLEELAAVGCDLVWATARLSAGGFYRRNGFESGAEFAMPPTGARTRYVWHAVASRPD